MDKNRQQKDGQGWKRRREAVWGGGGILTGLEFSPNPGKLDWVLLFLFFSFKCMW
jgi:hypothetical protein